MTRTQAQTTHLTGHLEYEVTMSVMEEQARTRRSFTDEFKRDAVAMELDNGYKIVDVAGRLGVGEARWGTGASTG